jgi:serine/threonine protein kinase
VRSNVNGVFSTYVGTGKATQNRVSIKEFHVQSKTCDSRMMKREISILHKLSSHISIPKLYELFLTDTSVYMVKNIRLFEYSWNRF